MSFEPSSSGYFSSTMRSGTSIQSPPSSSTSETKPPRFTTTIPSRRTPRSSWTAPLTARIPRASPPGNVSGWPIAYT